CLVHGSRKRTMAEHAGITRPKHFYSTELAPCPYLPGREERRLVALIEPGEPPELVDLLTEAGFRRSQHALYKPVCPGCRACVPVRIVVEGFRPSRTERRILKRNADLAVEERPPEPTHEQFRLFHRYLEGRHEEGGMVQMDERAYGEMVGAAVPGSRLVEFRRDDGRLMGVSLTDRLRSGLSGVYKFFAPDEERRSLGTFIILWHVRRARELGLPYVYLGYWIRDCRKMAYKGRFRPLERLDGDRWRPAVPEAEDS
ncbi:MAG TPA: arginyltransferase, partial [Geminicoccaceae bacterium]|nr:arginyltransferase [Geminicoccaceae bacterium]